MKQRVIWGLNIFLAACGGGGGGGDAPPPSITAEGLWKGADPAGSAVTLLVLGNGETWGVTTASSGAVTSALHGNTASSSTTLTGSGQNLNMASHAVTAITYTGTFVPQTSIQVTTSAGSSFSGAYQTIYNQSASLATASGRFLGAGVSASSPVQLAQISLASSGAITVQTVQECAATGTATPSPSGKVIFDVTLTFTGSACALGNGATAKGIAYYEASTQRLLVMTLNDAQSDGFIYAGQN